MRPWLLLALAGCRGLEATPLVLTLEEATWGTAAAPLEGAAVQVETRDGGVVATGFTDAEGRASFEVDWREQPFAVTAAHPAAPLWSSVAGIQQWNADTTLHVDPLGVEDLVLVRGQVAGRTPGTWLVAASLGQGGDVFAAPTDGYVVPVERGEPFTLLLAETTAVADPQSLFRSLDGWRLVAHDGVSGTTTWDLDLAELDPVEEHTARLEVLLPSAADADGQLAHAFVLSGSAGFRVPCGWSETSHPMGSTGFETDVAWVDASADDAQATLIQVGGDQGVSWCVAPGSPDQVEGPVRLPALPRIAPELDLGEAVEFSNLPAPWYPHLEIRSTAAAWTWHVYGAPDWGERGWKELWLPTPPAVSHRGRVLVTPAIVDRLAYADPVRPAICRSGVATQLVEVEPW